MAQVSRRERFARMSPATPARRGLTWTPETGAAGAGPRRAPSPRPRGSGGFSSGKGAGVGGRGGYPPFDMRQASEEDQAHFAEDEEALDELCATGRVGASQDFKKLSVTRRKHLHHLCDNVKPGEFGVRLQHESGPGAAAGPKTLTVRIVSKDSLVRPALPLPCAPVGCRWCHYLALRN